MKCIYTESSGVVPSLYPWPASQYGHLQGEPCPIAVSHRTTALGTPTWELELQARPTETWQVRGGA